MTDQPAVSASGDALTIEQIEAKFEERIKGLQRLYSGSEEARKHLEQEIEELKTAGLSDDERKQLRDDKLTRENAELKAKLELAQLAQEYGDEMPYFQELLSAKSAKDQLEIMRKVRGAPTAPSGTAQSESVEPPDVLPNNAPRTPVSGPAFMLPDGRVMTEADADRILQSTNLPLDGLRRIA